MIAFCQDKRRRDLVLRKQGLNGIDYLEVLGKPGCGRKLAVTFLKDPRSLALTPDNISLTGETVLTVLSITPPSADDPLTLTVTLDQTGDFAPYTLTLVSAPGSAFPPAGIDPQLSSVPFSFKAGCPSPVDCLPSNCCSSTPIAAPDIHYLARDYDGFRQQILDRMAVLVPGWTETHAADPAITLVEALAYAADRVSYLQDAVNTEAYLGTARSRISLRRHARLVDYHIQEGANARAWVCFTASSTGVTVPAGTLIYPLVPGLPAVVSPTSNAASILASSPGPVFATLETITATSEQNELQFYTFGDGQCCLPIGTTQATLTGTLMSLQPGQVLIFEEVMGPLTGDPADANPMNRCAVRLTNVTTIGADGTWLNDPVNGEPITTIEWSADDALTFPLCLSSVTDAEHGSLALPSVSVARGNVIAADQGIWVTGEALDIVPAPPPAPAEGGCDCNTGSGAAASRPRYQPTLAQSPLTFAVPYDATQPASTFLAQDIAQATPQIGLGSNDGLSWQPVQDLLAESAEFTGFVPEIENDGTAYLRFGDGTYGAAPQQNQTFTVTYRVGNGQIGNVGRESLAHILFGETGLSGVRNPLAAAGGTDPETAEHIRQTAPTSFQTQLRCVTADDYGTQTETLTGVREARGTLRWNGSWYTAFVSVDSSVTWTNTLQSTVKKSLNGLRMMGTDIVVEQAVLVGLRITLQICVAPNYFQGDVYSALWQALVTGDPCKGATGLLNAANFQFGETVYSSPIIALAQSIPGVISASITNFERMAVPTPPGTPPPVNLLMGPLEIPRCDNDPDHADRGLLTLNLDGGK